VFRTRDDEWIALGVLGEARLWTSICDALGLDDLKDLSFEARLDRGEAVNAAVAAAVLRLDRDDALARLLEHGAPVTPVLAPEETTAHPQIRERDFHVDSDAGLVAGLPARLSGDGRVLATHVPVPDEHPEGFAPR
jgi:crotonobetainyl-CoA:carnitine CoA-transferase CaiB-like acyl-CoA transferase